MTAMEAPEAERHVLGACLLDPEAVRFASELIGPEDFWNHHSGGLFHAMVTLLKEGEPVEPGSVHTKAGELGLVNVNIRDLYLMQEETVSSASVTYYAEQVKLASDRRRLHAISVKLGAAVQQPGIPPSQAKQEAVDALKYLQSGDRGMSTKTLAEVLDTEENHDWLIPNLLERGDRLVLTGYEGGGKSTWIRQLVLCMAAGIHPTTLNRLDSQLTVLVVDAENTESQWRSETRGMVHNIRRMSGVDPAPNIHIHAKGRINITRDAVLGEIHRLVDQHEPHVLAIGPIYKLVPTAMNNDTEAAPVISALDSLRDRGLVLLMEAHAGKPNSQTGHRDMAPRGSAALMGWPEFGFGMVPDPDNPQTSTIQRWRGDRQTGRDWPRELFRGGLLPWMGDTVSRGAQNHLNNMQAQDHYANYN